MRACLSELEDGVHEATDVLEAADDEDLELRLKATVEGDELTLDFTGSADQHDGNLNCPLAVTARPAGSPSACSPTPTSRPPPARCARSP